MVQDPLSGLMLPVFQGAQPPIVAAYVFGSVGRGTARDDSDVDVAILLEEDPPRTLDGLGLDLAVRLQEVLSRRVDLVVVNRAPLDLIHRVLRDGVLVFEADRSMRIRFEVRARRQYLDMLPYLREYRRQSSAGAE
jgi:predicted nucleotidyltransferase